MISKTWSGSYTYNSSGVGRRTLRWMRFRFVSIRFDWFGRKGREERSNERERSVDRLGAVMERGSEIQQEFNRDPSCIGGRWEREWRVLESVSLYFSCSRARVVDGRKINKIGRAFYFLVAGFRFSIPYIHDRESFTPLPARIPPLSRSAFYINSVKLANVIITFTFERGHSRFPLSLPFSI